MVKQAAHDSSDECSNHSGLKIAKIFVYLYTSPSAGIGRQCELKIRWFNIVNVQVVSWILVRLGKSKDNQLVHSEIMWHNSKFLFYGLTSGFYN